MHQRWIELADHYFAEYLAKIERAVEPLDEEDFWFRPDPRANSIANLLLHLKGNLSLWVLESLAGVPAHRQRGLEFSSRRGTGLAVGRSGPDLVAELAATVERCREAMALFVPETLTPVRKIQTYEAVDGYRALLHAVEHMSYHTGQIVLLSKMRLPATAELEFYPQHRGE